MYAEYLSAVEAPVDLSSESFRVFFFFFSSLSKKNNFCCLKAFRRPSGTAAAGQVCAELRNSRINLAHLAHSVVQADMFGAPSRKQEVHRAGKTNHWLFMCSRGCCDNVGLSCWRSSQSVCWFLLLQCRSLPLCLCPSPFILLFSVFGFLSLSFSISIELYLQKLPKHITHPIKNGSRRRGDVSAVTVRQYFDSWAAGAPSVLCSLNAKSLIHHPIIDGVEVTYSEVITR